MLKLNENYSDYTDETDENYPEGKAINASSSESFDGTPLLAEFMNDINAAHIAMYEKAYGDRTGISGDADTQKDSQFADAVAKYTDDKVKSHADERGMTDGVHGATSEPIPGQIASRDEFGNLKVGAAIEDEDAINKGDVDNIIKKISDMLVPVGTIQMYAGSVLPERRLWCDGAEVSRSTYSSLFAVIGTDYGAGDGITTFNLPDWRDRVPQGASETHPLGEKISAGIPNIIGELMTNIGQFIQVASGAFKLSSVTIQSNYTPSVVSQTSVLSQLFNAKDGECKKDGTCKTDADYHVYGASDTVQPPAQTCNFIIKY